MILLCIDCAKEVERKIRRPAVCKSCQSKRAESKRKNDPRRLRWKAQWRKNNWNKVLKTRKKATDAYRATRAGKNVRAAYEALRRARIKKRTPSWANLPAIREFYKNCPEGYHVDHIIPLSGAVVSGLHVLGNLQYLPAEENRKKSNKFNLTD